MPPAPTMPSTVETGACWSRTGRSTTPSQVGSTCGSTPKTMRLERPAPAERKASSGPSSISSIASAKNLPSMPAPWMARASTPANGPRPMAATKISARMISLMPRMQFSTWRSAVEDDRVRRRGCGRRRSRSAGRARRRAACPRSRSAGSPARAAPSLAMKAEVRRHHADRGSRRI